MLPKVVPFVLFGEFRVSNGTLQFIKNVKQEEKNKTKNPPYFCIFWSCKQITDVRLLVCDMIKMQKYDQNEKKRRSEVLITRIAGIKIYEAKTLRYIINKAVKKELHGRAIRANTAPINI